MSLKESIAGLTLRFVALTAVDGTIATGHEGHLSVAAATGANDFVHLAGAIVVATVLGTTGSTASGAAGGFILEALFRKEGLLVGREHEFVAAVTAGQGLVFVHGRKPPKSCYPYHW